MCLYQTRRTLGLQGALGGFRVLPSPEDFIGLQGFGAFEALGFWLVFLCFFGFGGLRAFREASGF